MTEENNIIQINQQLVKSELNELVRNSVEETLNNLLDAEADRLCNAEKYEHTGERRDTRAGSYQRKLETRVGKVNLKVPKLRKLPFETAIIERYKRRESSVEEALIEMYLAGVSVRRVEDITEALWGSKVSPGTISNLNKKVYARINEWRTRPLTMDYPYVYLDGIWLKRSWGGEVRNVSVLVAIGVNSDGYREILAVAEGAREDEESWLKFLRNLKERGLKGTQLFVSDKCLGLVAALGATFPESAWQRCVVHFYRNVFTQTPRGKSKEVAAMLKAIHAQEGLEEARRKAEEVVIKLKDRKLKEAAKIVAEGIEETLAYMRYPIQHWRFLRTNNGLERLMKEIRRRTRVVGSFPDGESAVMLAAARLRHVAGSKWGERKYLDMTLLNEKEFRNAT